mmetsp:Transcript_25348/g.42480  ORF Transcript_25348/g.42480 Transcript_25348/m.42480 type:complete len:914 (+) Transcript_25348:267-3008(+)|eukprot:CAMPEP_0198211896 /NCGR_PEP_ID=MMETSP1445-20131203/25402_1 /TAXON_ID=36898 /ORGANISM="Pyramimonas sp., Strain CCMP2087" /LENGTH=913 /DNA_ID=CAMNT_0043886251 /DNA_START=263 /DNA_END=3004 /DNA_ORIENTATION=-
MADEKQPLLTEKDKEKDGGSTEYGANGEGDLYYMGVLKSEVFDTDHHVGLTTEEAERRLEKFGRNELEEKEDDKWVKLALEFIQPMPIIIWTAIFVEVISAFLMDPVSWIDVFILLMLQFLNVVVGFYEELQAGNAIAALKGSLKPEAFVKRDGKYITVNAGDVVPGDIICLGSGGSVPADCKLLPGKAVQCDQAALTGESLPVTLRPGASAMMGSTITRGEIEAVCTATGGMTFFGKTAMLINNVDDMAHFEKIFYQINFSLTSLGGVCCVSVFMTLMLRGAEPLFALAFSTVLFVSSIPIAMRVVCTTTMALGCRTLAKEKAIVARLSAVEELAGMDTLCSDKTGTLTMNKMELQEDLPMFCDGITKHDVLTYAALAARWKEPPKDALDTLVLNAIDLTPLDAYQQPEFMPFDPTIKRTEATLIGPDGTSFKVTKGAPHVLLLMAHNHDQICNEVESKVLELAKRGIRSLAVAKTEGPIFEEVKDNKWVFLGILTFLDPPRPDTKITIKKCLEFGVVTKMITGDHKAIAVEMCRRLDMGTNVLGAENLPVKTPKELESKTLGQEFGPMILAADGFAQVFPEHKYLIVEALRQGDRIVGMTGDGVNDAPALKRADVGIAVCGATDAARASADIVLTEPGLSTIAAAVVISRKIFTRMKNFVIYRVACTIQLLIFFFVATIVFDPQSYDLSSFFDDTDDEWPSYFTIPTIAMVSIAILNDGTLIAVAYDNVEAGRYPEKWDLKNLYFVATVIGGVAMVSSMLLLDILLDSNNENGPWQYFGYYRLDYGEIMGMIYLKIALSDYLTLFNARTKGFAWKNMPSPFLLVAACFAMSISTMLAMIWPEADEDEDMEAIGLDKVIFVWIYTLGWSLVQDLAKVLTYQGMEKMGIITTADTLTAKDVEGLSIISAYEDL